MKLPMKSKTNSIDHFGTGAHSPLSTLGAVGVPIAIVELEHRDHPKGRVKESAMLVWALIFFIIAIIAAGFGFTGIAGAATSIAQILFVIFLVLFVIAMLVQALRGRPPV